MYSYYLCNKIYKCSLYENNVSSDLRNLLVIFPGQIGKVSLNSKLTQLKPKRIILSSKLNSNWTPLWTCWVKCGSELTPAIRNWESRNFPTVNLQPIVPNLHLTLHSMLPGCISPNPTIYLDFGINKPQHYSSINR